jgi:hypothetical protein
VVKYRWPTASTTDHMPTQVGLWIFTPAGYQDRLFLADELVAKGLGGSFLLIISMDGGHHTSFGSPYLGGGLLNDDYTLKGT